jgi:hypothetical protein
MSWSIIPQFFYDILARMAPGGLMIVAAVIVLGGPAFALDNLLEMAEQSATATTVKVAIFLAVSYFVAVVLAEFWEMIPRRLLRQRFKDLADEANQKRLDEHCVAMKALGKPSPIRSIKEMPEAFAMLDQLRPIAFDEAMRLLRLRSDQRLCHVAIVGLTILFIINVVAALSDLGLLISRGDIAASAVKLIGRLIAAILMIASLVAMWARAFRFERLRISSTTNLWLLYASAGMIPPPVDATKGAKDGKGGSSPGTDKTAASHSTGG